MEKTRRTSLFWIALLLAALFLGPAILLKNGIRKAEPGSAQPRPVAEGERLMDAPAPLPARLTLQGGGAEQR